MLVEVTREVEGVEQTVLVGPSLWLTTVLGNLSAWDIVDMDTGEIIVECNEEIDEDKRRRAPRQGHRRVRGALHRQRHRRRVPAGHPPGRQDREHRGGGHGDLPASPPRRPADLRRCAQALRELVLQRRALRPLSRLAA